ncbi:MAG: GNAT family N-acetyltransferase [Saccharospirillum sp.]|uniref:GNAT family N-acetyltransferase n=1 Tax=Saccharospirillum sp. TaxID=2033801 RepID=UPI003299B76B
MNITLVPAESFEYVKNLFQYYIYDMTEYTGWPPHSDGTFEVHDSVTGLSDYWTKPNHFPYLIKVDGEIAGFSLVRKYPEDEECFDMGQFFVLRKYKRKGIGEQAFKISASKHPGRWITRVHPSNTGAKEFWLKAIKAIASTKIVIETELYKTTEMEFIRYGV